VLSTEGGEKAHKIARADLAAFMVKELESSRYVRQAVTVTTT
jgi:putative NADH-flavin reductase